MFEVNEVQEQESFLLESSVLLQSKEIAPVISEKNEVVDIDKVFEEIAVHLVKGENVQADARLARLLTSYPTLKIALTRRYQKLRTEVSDK